MTDAERLAANERIVVEASAAIARDPEASAIFADLPVSTSNRYEVRTAWSTVYGLWGYRIFDSERGVFISPWYALIHRAQVVADNLNADTLTSR